MAAPMEIRYLDSICISPGGFAVSISEGPDGELLPFEDDVRSIETDGMFISVVERFVPIPNGPMGDHSQSLQLGTLFQIRRGDL